MAFIFCADIYCNDCGEAIRRRLTDDGKAPADPTDEWSYDSDEFPKCVDSDSEADSPQHCGANDNCINAIEIEGGKIGFLFGELTSDGVTYVEETIEDANCGPNTWNREVVKLWYRHYTDLGYTFKVVPNWI